MSCFLWGTTRKTPQMHVDVYLQNTHLSFHCCQLCQQCSRGQFCCLRGNTWWWQRCLRAADLSAEAIRWDTEATGKPHSSWNSQHSEPQYHISYSSPANDEPFQHKGAVWWASPHGAGVQLLTEYLMFLPSYKSLLKILLSFQSLLDREEVSISAWNFSENSFLYLYRKMGLFPLSVALCYCSTDGKGHFQNQHFLQAEESESHSLLWVHALVPPHSSYGILNLKVPLNLWRSTAEQYLMVFSPFLSPSSGNVHMHHINSIQTLQQGPVSECRKLSENCRKLILWKSGDAVAQTAQTGGGVTVGGGVQRDVEMWYWGTWSAGMAGVGWGWIWWSKRSFP